MPILLAAFASSAASTSGQRIYGLVFVVVLLSVLGQGTLVPWVAGRLGIPMHVHERLPWELSVRLGEEPAAVHEATVEPGSSWDGVASRTCRSPTTRGSRSSCATGRRCSPTAGSRCRRATGCC